jgi:hypothetical protein
MKLGKFIRLKESEKLAAAIILSMLLAFGCLALAGCGNGSKADSDAQAGQDASGSADNQADGNGAENQAGSGDTANEQMGDDLGDWPKIDGLPVTISAYDSSYSIQSFKITENEDGNTVVSAKGKGFGTLPFRNNKIVIQVYCAIIVNGTETELASIQTNSDGCDFIFNKKLDPDTVVFYSGESNSDRHEIAVK